MIFGVSLHVLPHFPGGRPLPSYARTHTSFALGVPGLLFYILPHTSPLLGLPLPMALEIPGALLLLASGAVYASSIIPRTLLIWRTRDAVVPPGSWEGKALPVIPVGPHEPRG